MKIAEHLPEDELVLFALSELEPEAAAYAVVHLRHCDQCRAEVARLQGDLVLYAMSAPFEAPPGESRARLLQAVAQEAKFTSAPVAPAPAALVQQEHFAQPVREPQEPLLVVEETRSRTAAAWIGWALAACLAAMAGWLFLQNQDLRKQVTLEASVINSPQAPVGGDVVRAREIIRTLTDPAALQIALREPSRTGTPKPDGHVAYNPESGDLLFVGSHLRPLRGDHTYELWLLPATGANPIPAGLFRPDLNGNATVVLPELPKNVAARGFGVTIERDGGSAAPTLPIMLAGTAS